MNDSNAVLPPTDGTNTPIQEVSLPDVSSQPVAATGVAALPVSDAGSTGQAKLSADSPTIAEDVDLIEKEWVAKAKAIVARTTQDPNLQSKELSKYKADYLKTRFNKDIKASE